MTNRIPDSGLDVDLDLGLSRSDVRHRAYDLFLPVAWTLLVVLASNPRDEDWIQCVHNQENWLFCMTGPFIVLLTEPVVATMLVVAYEFGLWFWSRSIYPVAVTLVLFAGTLIVPLGSPAARAAALVVTLGVTMAYYAIWRRRR